MTNAIPDRRLEEILGDLIEIPLRQTDSHKALTRLTELCSEALKSRACTLVWVDLEQRLLTQVACAGFDEEFVKFMAEHKINYGALTEGDALDFDLGARGDIIKKYNLPHDGGGVANPEVAERYGLQSVLCLPLKLDGRLIGYLNHFSSSNEPFTPQQENLLKLFSRQAENIVEQSSKELSLTITQTSVRDLLRLSPGEFLSQIPNRVCHMLPDSVCLIWKLDAQEEKLRIIAASDTVDEEFRRIALDPADLSAFFTSKKPRCLLDVSRSQKYRHAEEAKARGWVSLLSVPMLGDHKFIGLLEVYTRHPHSFSESEKELLEDFATLAGLSIQKDELQEETSETLTRRKRLEEINYAMALMAEERDVHKILRLLLVNTLRLVELKWGWVMRLNPRAGALEVTAKVGTSLTPPPLKYGMGITWKAILERRPQLANDVRSMEWARWYAEVSSETKSELAIPLVIDQVAVRAGSHTKIRSRAIGVLNLVSPEVGAFSETDITYIMPLVRQAALLIDRLEAEQKSNKLREVERRIIGRQNWREVLQTVVQGIRDTLGFEHVNVSLVNRKISVIRSEYVVGLPEAEIDAFKQMAIHSLDSDDIHADIVRTKKIEVPEPDDPRFDKAIFTRFLQASLIRVFIPMISPSNGEVIGTLEAGYQRSYRDFIYESDIQILQSFISYVVEAIEPSRLAMLETISHELRSSIVGIRGSADYSRFIGPEDWDTVETKLNDILTDSEILLLNVAELEYFMGRTSPAPKIERVLVVRDIVIKTINQLKLLVKERGFDPKKIAYPRADAASIRIFVEKAKLNQVVSNLLLNAIKYAEDDPNSFSIEVSVEEHQDEFILKFADWGMGVRQGHEEKIFEYGFRTPEARAMNVSGSGLGLTIAKERMREIGGDLVLAKNSKPTEFHMLIPKKLLEAPK